MILPDMTWVIFSPVIFSVLPLEFTTKLSWSPTTVDLVVSIFSVWVPVVAIYMLALFVMLKSPSVTTVLVPAVVSVTSPLEDV